MAKRLFLSFLICCAIYSYGDNQARSSAVNVKSGNTISLMDAYPLKFYFNDRLYLANLVLMCSDSPSSGSNVWILKVAWTYGGSVVQVEMIPGHSVGSFLSAHFDKKIDVKFVSTRFVASGEMCFLERNFLESLSLVPKSLGAFVLESGDPLYFRISPGGVGTASILGYFWDQGSHFKELNPGLGKIGDGFRSSIPWIFADWLICDGNKIDKAWLSMAKKSTAKPKLN